MSLSIIKAVKSSVPGHIGPGPHGSMLANMGASSSGFAWARKDNILDLLSKQNPAEAGFFRALFRNEARR